MATIRNKLSVLLTGVREFFAVHVRVLLPLAIAVVVGFVVLGFLLVLYATAIGLTVFEQLTEFATTAENATLVTIGLMIPIIAVALLASLVWAGIAVQLANAASSRRRISIGGAALVALRRAPRVFALFMVILGAVLAAVVLAPVLTVAGIVGLLLSIRLTRLPRRAVLIAMAVPFGVAIILFVRWSLAPASVWLAATGVRAALADSNTRVRGREIRVGLVLLVTAGLSLLLTLGITALAAQVSVDVYTELIGQLVALILVGPMLFVAAAGLYRRGSVEAPPKAPAVSGRASRQTRTAVAVILAMVVPLFISVSPASAAGSGEVSYTVSVEPGSPVVADQTVTLNFTAVDVEAVGEPTGTVTVTIDGGAPLGPFALVNGAYAMPYSFSAGSHLIESEYSGDLDFEAASASRTVVAGYQSTVALTPSNASPVYGTANTLTATITTTGTPTGTVEFTAFPTVGSAVTLGTPAVSGGEATVDASALLPGSYMLSASYSGDATHLVSAIYSVPLDVIAANTEITFDIDPNNSSIAFSPTGTVFTATVTVSSLNSPELPRGSVLVRPQGGGSAYDIETLVDGVADLSFTGLEPVLSTVVFEYLPDPGFNSSQIDHTLYISKYVPGVSLVAAPTPSALGESVSLTATVTTTGGPVPTGDVTFEATPTGGGAAMYLGLVPVNGSGVAVLTTSTLPVGEYTIVASYSGDGQVAAGSDTATHTVGKGAVTVEVDSSIPAPEFGATPDLNITVSPLVPGADTPTGSVEVWRDGSLIDTVPLNGAGAVTVAVGVGSAGVRHFTVKYLGDANFTIGDVPLDLTVSKAATTTTLLPLGDADADYGDSLTFDGNVAASSGPAPSGTVQLYVGGYHVADGTLTAGSFSIVTDLSHADPALQDVWIVYPGDANHVNSESFPRRSLQVESVTVVPVITVSPTVFGVGSTVTVTATFDALGAGPAGGDVIFSDGVGAPKVGTFAGNTATTTFEITTIDTWINAHYNGNGNYEPADAAPVMITGTQVPVTVTMTAPGPRLYGEVFNLTASVVLDGGATATGTVAFTVGSGAALTPTAPVIGGVATLQVCAGDALGCPSGMPVLGTTNSTITASYAATSISLAGAATPVPYTMTNATTTTTLVVNPSTVRPSSGLINLTATVTSVGSSAVPRGFVIFEYTTGGVGPGLLQNVRLNSSGVATYSPVLSGPFAHPVDGVRATYVATTFPGDLPFASFRFAASSDDETLTIDRYSLGLGVSVSAVGGGSPVVGSPATVTVIFNPEAGSTATFPEPVTVTSDTGATCTATAAPGTSVASCNLAWTTAGSHTVTATYPGDTAFEPGSGNSSGLTLTKGTPNLAPNLTTNPVMALTDDTVTWSLFHAGATGTVTVIADGVTWCTAVPLATQSCTGQFPLSSASSSSVLVRVQYSGDANWESREQTVNAIVKRCVPVDVTSENTALGTVTIDTPSNCAGGQYLAGTTITITAHPIAPNLFVDWKKLGGLGFVHDSYLTTMSFVATADFMTWTRVASFMTNCYPVTPSITGHGGMSVYPVSNCTLPGGGGGGYLPGTVVSIYPDIAYNPNFLEKDAFYSFGTVTGSTLKKDSSARPYLSVPVNGPLTIPVNFGPNCRLVTVVFDPASAGDAVTIPTAEDCQSPFGNGFLRYSAVAVHAVSGDPTLAIVGWKFDGVEKPDWGTSNDQSFRVESAKPTLTVNLVHCYTLDVKVDGAQDARSREVGSVDIDTKPNCPDGSKRYLIGTKVTLTPEILVEGAAFNGWDLVRIPETKAPGGKGKITAQARIVTMTADTKVKAGFVFSETCSKIQVIDNAFGSPTDNVKVFTLDDNGCGESEYFDLQAQMALRDGESPESHWSDSDRTELIAHINPRIPLDVYLSVQGDTGTCFDGVIPRGPTEDTDAWKTYGPLKGDVTCSVGGDIALQAAACQTVTTTGVGFINEDDPAGKVYPRSWFPNTFYLPNADGSVGTFDQGSFEWMTTATVAAQNGELVLADLGDDPCTRAGINSYPAGRSLAVYGLGLSSGFTVAGWDGLDEDGRVDGNPVLIETDDAGPVFPVNPVFSVSCGKLVLGEGISVIDGARCPGTVPEQSLFVMGTAIQVRAAQHVGDRVLYGFKSGVVGNQIVEEPVSKRLIGLVVMDLDGKAVTGDYPTKSEAIGRAIVQGLKISAGILAVLAPITLGLLFPPAGIFFAFLGAAAGIVQFIPHGKEVAGVLDLINPTKITACAARWGFSNTGNPTGGVNPGSIGSLAWTGFKVYKGKDVITQNIGKFGIGGAVLGTASGLYEAGIHHAELGPQSVEQLAGTSTMTGCLDDQWRIANSNLSGN